MRTDPCRTPGTMLDLTVARNVSYKVPIANCPTHLRAMV